MASASYLQCDCGGKLNAVTDSRMAPNFQGLRGIRRYRRCDTCGKNSPTIELRVDDVLASKVGIAEEVINVTRDLLRKNVIERLRGIYR